MAAELNYVVNLDHSRVMGSAFEISNAVQMAMARGFQGGQIQSMGGGGGAGTGLSDAVSGGLSGISQMSAQLVRFPTMMPGYAPMFGGTFTDQSMAYTPHWGMQQAETSLQQEWLVSRYGLAGAQRMRPPGVGALEYANAVNSNFIDRKVEAADQAFTAARTSAKATLWGTLAGEGAGAMGGFLVGAVADKMLPGMKGVGKLIGNFGGFMVGNDIAESVVTQQAAEVEQSRGIIRELGEIAGGDRGLTATQRTHLGAAAMAGAKDAGIDVNYMGDILAGSRGLGMLPSSTDPQKFRQQSSDLARTVDEWASSLHTSVAKAMSMIKGMTAMQGGSAESSLESLIKMGAGSGLGAEQMYGIGMAGAGVARQNLLPGRIGFGLFTSGVMQASGGLGMDREHLGMIGGVSGAGQMIAMTQMGQALGPMGDVQLMAARTGRALSTDGYGLAAQAIEGMSQGGDFIKNMIDMSVNSRSYLEKQGAAGVKTMANAQVATAANLYEQSFGIDHQTAVQRVYMDMGKNQVEAKALANAYLHQGTGGGGGGNAGAALMEHRYNAFISDVARQMTPPPPQGSPALSAVTGTISDIFSSHPGLSTAAWSLGGAVVGGVGGFLAGGIPGAGLGVPFGMAAGPVIGGLLGSSGGGITGTAAAPVIKMDGRSKEAYEEELAMSAKKEAEKAAVKMALGDLGFDPAMHRSYMARVGSRSSDFSHSVYDLDTRNPRSSAMIGGLLELSGLQGTPLPVGTESKGIMRAGGNWYSLKDVLSGGAGWGDAKHDAASTAIFDAYKARGIDADDLAAAKRLGIEAPLVVGHLDNPALVHQVAADRTRLLSKVHGNVAAVEDVVSAAMGQDFRFPRLHPRTLGQVAMVTSLREDEVRRLPLVGEGLADKLLEVNPVDRARLYEARQSSPDGRVANQESEDDFRQFFRHAWSDKKVQAAYLDYSLAAKADVSAHSSAASSRTGQALKHLQAALIPHARRSTSVNANDVGSRLAAIVHGEAEGLAQMAPADRAALLQVGEAHPAPNFADPTIAPNFLSEAFASDRVIAHQAANAIEESKNTGGFSNHPSSKAAKARGPGTASQAVGFGQQESAMSTISRALSHTEKALRALEARFSNHPPQGAK